jgi:hypothetical protein
MTKYDQHNIINKLRLNLHTSNINIFLQNLSWSKCKYKFNILNVPSFVTPFNLLMHTFQKPMIITNNIALYYKIISCCKISCIKNVIQLCGFTIKNTCISYNNITNLLQTCDDMKSFNDVFKSIFKNVNNFF